MVIEGFLTSGNLQQAEEYIQSVRNNVDNLIPKRFCENETVNLLCSAFSEQAKELDINLQINVCLPKVLSISDTELCALLSNGLENALQGASRVDHADRFVSLFCKTQRNKLLLEIRNPYSGEIIFRDGLPISDRTGHGYGCQSIRTIVEQHRGICSFEPKNHIFSLRIMLPVNEH